MKIYEKEMCSNHRFAGMLFVTAYTKGETKNAQASYLVSEQDDGSETFETDHGFYTDADNVDGELSSKVSVSE